MLKYILRRLLLFIPTLIIISLLAFLISVNAPGDPVTRMLTTEENGSLQSNTSQQQKLLSHQLGLDLPVFYFSITPASFPDSLYKFYDRQERAGVQSLLFRFGNWNEVERYHNAVKKLLLDLVALKADSYSSGNGSQNAIHDTMNQGHDEVRSLLGEARTSTIERKLRGLQLLFSRQPFFISCKHDLDAVRNSFSAMQSAGRPWDFYLPAIHFYPRNQYQRWLFGDGNYSHGLLHGDFGISYVSRMPVVKIIWEHIGWSLLLTLISVVLAYLISIPLGIKAAMREGTAFDRGTSAILLLLHAIPSFWMATLLIITFANPDILYWFEASGVKPPEGYPAYASMLEKIRLTLPYLILPSIAYTYSSLAFLSRLTRSSMLEVLQQPYVRTARAKGLSERTVIYKHAFRNALLPIITVFGNILPAALGGSVILETIFSIPGMGLETYQAIQNQDYPMVVGVFTFTGLLTIAGYLIADVLYSVADPRISLSKTSA